jgi:Flp pilus assembly protein CpaB
MAYAQKLMATRWGMTVVAGTAAVLAGVLVLVYVAQYRDKVKSEGAPVTVLVARQTIPKGTTGAVIATTGLYSATTVRQAQLSEGALSDAANLRDKVAVHDIYPGAELAASDFAPAQSNIASTLTDRQRLIAVPFDAAHGMLDNLQVGDRVDVYAGFNVIPLGRDGAPISGGQARPVTRMIMGNILVASIDKKASGGGANIGFKVSDTQAAELAFASDNGKLWIGIRPSANSKAAPPSIVTLETLLLGVQPVTALHSFGGRR